MKYLAKYIDDILYNKKISNIQMVKITFILYSVQDMNLCKLDRKIAKLKFFSIFKL